MQMVAAFVLIRIARVFSVNNSGGLFVVTLMSCGSLRDVVSNMKPFNFYSPILSVLNLSTTLCCSSRFRRID